jgi:hypothetical protein
MFGLTRSSKYNDLKKQITKLKEEIIPKLKEELDECESGQINIEEEIGNDKVGREHVVGTLRRENWENKMKRVYEKGAR